MSLPLLVRFEFLNFITWKWSLYAWKDVMVCLWFALPSLVLSNIHKGSGKTELCKHFQRVGFKVLDENFLDMPSFPSLHPQSLVRFPSIIYACWYIIYTNSTNSLLNTPKKCLVASHHHLSFFLLIITKLPYTFPSYFILCYVFRLWKQYGLQTGFSVYWEYKHKILR